MPPLFMLAGAPAVGKSSTGKALAARYAKSLCLPVDDLRNMVVSGIAWPGPVWSAELIEQIALARTTAVHMALAYRQAGFAMVIDDFWDSAYISNYRELFLQAEVYRVVLYPNPAEAHRRNHQRSGDDPVKHLLDQGIRTVYQMLEPELPRLVQEGWRVIDSTELNLEQTVDAVLQGVVG